MWDYLKKISDVISPDSCPSCNVHVPEAVYEAHCRLSLELKDFAFGQTNQTESDNRVTFRTHSLEVYNWIDPTLKNPLYSLPKDATQF